MSTHRPYRASLGIDGALDKILKGRGTLYDSDVTDVAVRLFRDQQRAPAALANEQINR